MCSRATCLPDRSSSFAQARARPRPISVARARPSRLSLGLAYAPIGRASAILGSHCSTVVGHRLHKRYAQTLPARQAAAHVQCLHPADSQPQYGLAARASMHLALYLTRAAARPLPSACVRSPQHRVRCVGGSPVQFRLGVRKPQPAESVMRLLLTNLWLGRDLCRGMQREALRSAGLNGGPTLKRGCAKPRADVNFTAGDGCHPCCRYFYDTFVYGGNGTLSSAVRRWAVDSRSNWATHGRRR
jgi:hypothetical protein